ncbi:Hypothetical predicted protein [Paramuricea clavata]|uniref:Uncharacterized protein n=1 Tax=Paramuricea clavata TaxID=317549 RepID=A0A7D9D6L3_PARCT|nr:Hypothetical predicted protein [Paramuricea clavata]
MKITCTLLSLCCCILFLSTSAKDETGRTALKGDSGLERKGDKFPFCPIDKKRSKQIKEITAILKQSTASKGKVGVTDSRKGSRSVRSTSSCTFPFPHCGIASLRIDADGVNTIHGPMRDCCSDCRGVFDRCVSGMVSANKSCLDCLDTWTRCMNNCTLLHFCNLSGGTTALRPGVTGATTSVHKQKGSKGPKKSNLCPTKKVKNGGSYCIKRSCFPIRV